MIKTFSIAGANAPIVEGGLNISSHRKLCEMTKFSERKRLLMDTARNVLRRMSTLNCVGSSFDVQTKFSSIKGKKRTNDATMRQ
ncbi:hypothetical protein DdX_07008 [Ditylenchus destructor]|uniref:Uncharacterized protein n=1 Tax=Ditylenchus destructor TaxID=166010 RepID=A0AAD4R282_9BILA|nr:hypothetical protein DdX_07008 [Ditylenchus destructor]